MTALIQIENLTYRPESLSPEKPDILSNLSLTINEGQFIAIVGENGSGKTSLIKHINALLLPTKGQVLVSRLDTRDPDHRDILRSLVGMVFQNPADQIVASTVEEDVAFGLENLNLPTEVIRERVYKQLEAVGLTEEASRPPYLLSGGQVQLVALAGVLARQPKIILFDEPTSMLDPQSRNVFMSRISQLNKEGITVVFVTHHMDEAVFADQVVVMHEGKIKLTGIPADVFENQEILHEVGLEIPEAKRLADGLRSVGLKIDAGVLSPDALLNAVPEFELPQPLVTNNNRHDETQPPEPIISLKDVSYTYLRGTPLAKHALLSADLEVKPESIHGIIGANGSGKSTLLQHINGILRPDSGSVHVRKLTLEDPDTSLRDVIKMVGLVFQNPETQFFEVFTGDEIAYGPKQFKLDEIRERVRQAMALVGLNFEDYKDRRVETLSGGEKRKVALASTLVLDQDILIFDEPTAGMDPRSRDALLNLFQNLGDQGKTIVIASHRLEELAHISQEISVMKDGKVNQTASKAVIFSDLEELQEIGIMPPLAVEVSVKLIEKGWPIQEEDTSTVDRLVDVVGGLVQ